MISKISKIVGFVSIFLSCIVFLLSYFIFLKNDNQSIQIRNNEQADKYIEKINIYLNYTLFSINFGIQYMKRYDIFNSTLQEYIQLSSLNNSEISSIINNLRLHYNVSHTNRLVYEQQLSILTNQTINFTYFNDTKLVVSPVRPWYCPTFFVSPIKNVSTYIPGFDVCSLDNFDITTVSLNKMKIASRFSNILNEYLLDFIYKLDTGFVLLTISIKNIITTLVKTDIEIFQDTQLLYKSCEFGCMPENKYSKLLDFTGIPLDVMFYLDSYNHNNSILFVLSTLIIVNAMMFLILVIFENQRKRFVIVEKMMGYVNHEIRNPLNCVFGLISICINNLQGTSQTELLQNLYTAQKACDMLTNIVNDSNDLRKLKNNQLVMKRELINIPDFCVNLQELFSPKLNEKTHIKFVIKNKLTGPVIFDYQRLSQILLNFLSNSLKFTNMGSITLVFENVLDKVKISVIDTGIGIKKEDYKNIFKEFDQNNLNIFQKEGIGLGLYLCKMIMDQSNGEIGFSSKFGKGSVFWIKF